MDSTTIQSRPLASHDELKACVQLQHETWGDDFSDVVPVSILKVCQRIGGVAVGAFSEDGDLLGFVFGLTGVEKGRIVHWSDMLAVRPDARNLGLGRRLKEHQRCAVRELGADVIYWTYDPLVARNAHLNFNRLGVRMSDYVEDMYGVTDSVLHGGMPTDRIIVAWPTRDEEIAERLAASERVLASFDCRQAPVVNDDFIEGAAGAKILPHCVRIAIPLDAESMLTSHPGEACRWRVKVRRLMLWAIRAGYVVTAFDIDEAAQRGYYLMTKQARVTPNGHT
jgi:predicted GNAT superfamily acetyltransferase